MRPIGGWLFGRIADKHGRKKIDAVIGVYDVFRLTGYRLFAGLRNNRYRAPALLLLARLFRGLSVGGEYGTSATYMSEVAVEGRKGFTHHFSM